MEVKVVVEVAVAVTVAGDAMNVSWLGEAGCDASATGVPVVAVLQALNSNRIKSGMGSLFFKASPADE